MATSAYRLEIVRNLAGIYRSSTKCSRKESLAYFSVSTEYLMDAEMSEHPATVERLRYLTVILTDKVQLLSVMLLQYCMSQLDRVA